MARNGRYRRGAAAAITMTMLLLPSELTAQPAQTAIQRQWFAAIDGGNITTIANMLDSRRITVNSLVDGQNNTALHLAAERCNVDVVRYLLSSGARRAMANRWNDTPMRIAIARCGASSPVVQVLRRGN